MEIDFESYHQRLYEGVFKFAGKIRDYDITKKEWGFVVILFFRNLMMGEQNELKN